MKNKLVLVLALFLVTAILAGCASGPTPTQISYIKRTAEVQSRLNRVDELALVLLISGKITKSDAMSVYQQSKVLRHNLDVNVSYVWKHGTSPLYEYGLVNTNHQIQSLKTFIHVQGGYVVVVGKHSNHSLFVGGNK